MPPSTPTIPRWDVSRSIVNHPAGLSVTREITNAERTHMNSPEVNAVKNYSEFHSMEANSTISIVNCWLYIRPAYVFWSSYRLFGRLHGSPKVTGNMSIIVNAFTRIAGTAIGPITCDQVRNTSPGLLVVPKSIEFAGDIRAQESQIVRTSAETQRRSQKRAIRCLSSFFYSLLLITYFINSIIAPC